MTSGRLEYLLQRPWRSRILPVTGDDVPTVLSLGERALLYALARDYVNEDGTIVVAGCFLGDASVAVLSGLGDRQEPWHGPPVESYDSFAADPHAIPEHFGGNQIVRPGESYRALFDANVAKFDVPHVVHEGDVAESGWSGGPIDILFLDSLGTWELNDAVLRDFFPSLRPGRSVVVHQDYGSGWTPWIPIGIELMAQSLRLIDGMEFGSHVFFLQADPQPI